MVNENTALLSTVLTAAVLGFAFLYTGLTKGAYTKTRIVAAANILYFYDNREPVLLVGVRHWDEIMRKQFDLLGLPNPVRDSQGFIDNQGKFYTRTEAWAVAVKAKQIVRLVGNQYDLSADQKLYSENLY